MSAISSGIEITDDIEKSIFSVNIITEVWMNMVKENRRREIEDRYYRILWFLLQSKENEMKS